MNERGCVGERTKMTERKERVGVSLRVYMEGVGVCLRERDSTTLVHWPHWNLQGISETHK